MANVIIPGPKKSLSLLPPVPLETENLTGAGNNKPETIVRSDLEYINLKLKAFGGQQKGGGRVLSFTAISRNDCLCFQFLVLELCLFPNIGSLVVFTA